MIKILIIEDTKNKREKIQQLLTEQLMIEKGNICYAECVIDAKRKLSEKAYDLVILDLFLPLRKGENPQPEHGRELLSDIEITENINVPLHIIGLTANDIDDKDIKYFNQNCWHIFKYEANSVDWQDRIKSIANHLIKTRKAFFKKYEYNFDVAIITALQTEFDEVLNLYQSWEDIKIDGEITTFKKGKFKKGKKEISVIIACLPQMGMTASSNLATRMINIFSPKYIFMTGICAGIDKEKLNYGDIIVAEQSWDYGSGKLKQIGESEIEFEQDPRPIQLSPELKDKVNNFMRKENIISQIKINCKYNKGDKDLKVHFGPIATGSYVVASSAILNDIKLQQRKLLGVEMEGYGVYYAAEHTNNQKTKAMMVKSVSDFGDSSKSDNFQKYASFTSANFIYNFIIEELI